MIAPAALDESGKPADFSTMEEQMRVTYANAAVVFVISYLLLYRPARMSKPFVDHRSSAEPMSLGAACFRAVRTAIGDRLNDEEAGILAALLGKLYKSGHDDG
jgi:hypothetical protein